MTDSTTGKSTYFKLFEDCIPVRGVIRSIIYDLGRMDSDILPHLKEWGSQSTTASLSLQAKKALE
jgi:hypothetical protein